MVRRLRRVLSYRKLMKQIRLINLFKSFDSRTELDIRNEFLSTRIHMILLIITCSIFIHYYGLLISTATVTIQFPSLDTIVNMNKSSLACPCSIVGIPFETFSSIQPIFHPICSSDFINETWFSTVDITNNQDVRQLQMRFRILSLFCELARQTFQSQFRQWSNSYFLSTELLSRNQFVSQINVSIDQTLAMARSTFANSLQLVINTTQINKLLSADNAFQPDGAVLLIALEIPTMFYNKASKDFSCRNSNQLGNIVFNQFYTNCDPIEALLMSSLFSFYDRNIVNSLSSYIGNGSYRPLNLPIIYSKNATISFILNTLMLDTYSVNSSYEVYFHKCNPKRCIYTKITHKSHIDTVLAAFGLVGGLTGIFHVVIWYLIRWIRRPNKRSNRNTQQKTILNLIIWLRNKLLSWNLFRYSGSTERNEIISTRVFIFLFIIIFVILIFYTSLTFTTHSKTINKPNYDTFVTLHKNYSLTLTCPCSNMVFSYRSFISFSPKFHQICSSIFVDSRFFSQFFDMAIMYNSDDLFHFAGPIFTTIQIFCDLSRKTVEEQVNLLLGTRFVSSEAMNEQQFVAQIYGSIQAMIQASQRRVAVSIKLIRDTTYSNQVRMNQNEKRH